MFDNPEVLVTVTDQVRPGGTAPPDPAAWPDRDLLDQMVTWHVEQNRLHAARLDALTTFHDRRVAERERKPKSEPGFFLLTPLQETKAEVAPLLGVSEQTVEFEIDTTCSLKKWLPRLWDRCRAGRLDVGRAASCLDQLPYLATDADRAEYAEAVQDWFDKHDPVGDPDDPAASDGALCTLTRDRIQRASRYQRLKRPQRAASETFAEAYRKRRVSLRIDEESGMACLSSILAAHDAMTADHRLTLIAKKRAQAPGEDRTLAQLRADSLLDLIHGRLHVPATTGDLEHHGPCDRTCRVNGAEEGDEQQGESPGSTGEPTGGRERACPLHPLVLTADGGGPLGGYARPVVNVTVPISTLMGFGDDPGVMSGGTAIPADYARHIATQPGSTWYRMLTDDAGSFLALSTESYQPTEPIWRVVVSRDHTCLWPGCRRPAVVVHLDHRVPHPKGATSTVNLGPLCLRHHHVKHADGFGLVRDDDGSYIWTTRHGSTFKTPPAEQPVMSSPSTGSPGRAVDEVFAAITSPMEREFTDLLLTAQCET